MTIKERFAAIKKLVFEDPILPPTGATELQKEYKLKDGTVCVISDLNAGGTVTISGAPAPDGELELEDGTKIKVAGGVITDVAPAGANPADPANMNTDFTAQFEQINGQFTAFKNEFAAYKQGIEQQFAQQNQIIEQQKKALQDMVTIVEQLSEIPAADPVEAPKNNFSSQSFESRGEKLKSYAAAIKKSKENK